MGDARDPVKGRSDNLAALGGATLFLLAGVALIAFARLVLGITGDFIFVTLLLLPLLVWAIVTDRLAELSLPGGANAKFRAVAPATMRTSRLDVNIAISSAFMSAESGALTGPTLQPLGTSQTQDILSRIQQLILSGSTQLIEVNLSRGTAWWSTRLFLLASLVNDYSSSPRFVFTTVCNSGSRCWIGMASPAALLRAMTAIHPELTPVFRKASGEARLQTAAPIDEVGQVVMAFSHGFAQIGPQEVEVKHDVAPELLTGWLGSEMISAAVNWESPGVTQIRLLREILDYKDPYVPLVSRQQLVEMVDRNLLATQLAQIALSS